MPPVFIARLATDTLLALLAAPCRLTMPELIGLQAEADRRRERGWNRIGGRFGYRYAPRRFNDRAHNAGYFDSRYFDARKGVASLVTF